MSHTYLTVAHCSSDILLISYKNHSTDILSVRSQNMFFLYYKYTWKLLWPFFLVLSDMYLFFSPLWEKTYQVNKNGTRLTCPQRPARDSCFSLLNSCWNASSCICAWISIDWDFGPLSCYVNSWSTDPFATFEDEKCFQTNKMADTC